MAIVNRKANAPSAIGVIAWSTIELYPGAVTVTRYVCPAVTVQSRLVPMRVPRLPTVTDAFVIRIFDPASRMLVVITIEVPVVVVGGVVVVVDPVIVKNSVSFRTRVELLMPFHV